MNLEQNVSEIQILVATLGDELEGLKNCINDIGGRFEQVLSDPAPQACGPSPPEAQSPLGSKLSQCLAVVQVCRGSIAELMDRCKL